jgi:hypothetical protein
MKIVDIVSKVRKSVVRIVTIPSDSGNGNEVITGSGIVIDKRGVILTNRHIVNSENATIVISFNGAINVGRILCSNLDRDVAFVYSGQKNLIPARFNYSKKINIGEEIIVIGHPENLPYSVTKGIISYPNRILEKEKAGLSYIQFDAPTHPGSSGGALLDFQGRVIGIVCEGFGESLNLAIPVCEIRAKIADIKKRLGWYNASKYCSICGEANDCEKRHCKRCGVKLISSNELRKIIEDKRIFTEYFIFCKYCKNLDKLKDPEKTSCSFCDHPLNSTSLKNKRKTTKSYKKKIICSICKKGNSRESRYCSNCGNDLLRERKAD